MGPVSRAIGNGEPLDRYRDTFLDWVSSQTVSNVIISSEGFALNDPLELARFVDVLQWDKITVIAYLRPQAEYLEGWYKQIIKWGGKIRHDQFLAQPGPHWAPVDYDRLLNRWDEWCQSLHSATLQVRLFNDAIKGINFDIIQDFLGIIDITNKYRPSEMMNISPSRALIELYLKLPPINQLQKVNRRMVASGHPATTGTRDLFSPEQSTFLSTQFAEINQNVCARYFPDRRVLFPLYPPPPPPSQADIESLKCLLIKTLTEMHGDNVARAASKAISDHDTG